MSFPKQRSLKQFARQCVQVFAIGRTEQPEQRMSLVGHADVHAVFAFHGAWHGSPRKKNAPGRISTTGAKPSEDGEEEHKHAREHGSGCFFGAAQHGPFDVRPQVFAADCAVGGLLDGWAVLGGDSASAPVGYGLCALIKPARQLRYAIADINSPVKGGLHAAQSKPPV